MIIFLGNGNSLELYKDLVEQSKNDKPDIVVSCQYPFKVPESLLKSHICVNIHYGMLPEFAGCNPIYWQIKEGDVAGTTIHYMEEKLDAGDVISRKNVPIGDMTANELYKVLACYGFALFKKAYPKILNNTAPRRKQDLKFRCYYPKNMVNFELVKSCVKDQDVRAVHFEGKQYPVISIGGRDYEMRAV